MCWCGLGTPPILCRSTGRKFSLIRSSAARHRPSVQLGSFKGSDIYTTDEVPEIDILFITHDHWDHLDYKTLLQLKPKINRVICGLGTGAHLATLGLRFGKNHRKSLEQSR